MSTMVKLNDCPIKPEAKTKINRAVSAYPVSLRFSRWFLAKLTAAGLVFLLSLLVMPYYTSGDQYHYIKVYEELPALGLIEGYLFYFRSLTSREVTHFFLSWMASRFVNKDLFIAISNAILAYIAMSLFQKWKASVIIALFVVLTNYYFFVLYFAAERLKYGFIFLALSLIYFNHIKRFSVFAILGIISHVQVLIVYGTILGDAVLKRVMLALRTMKVSRNVYKFVFFVPFLLIPALWLQDHIIYKFLFYFEPRPLIELIRILAFLVLALWYSKKRGEVLTIFIPMIIAVSMIGGDRLNVFGYFVFLHYALQVRGGWNIGVLATSTYFAYTAILFLANIFQHGHGFP